MLKRYNQKFGKDSCIIVAGEYLATRDDMLIETVLGSCISVCLMDPVRKVSGMNHFMLPSNRGTEASALTREGRYGVHAMELLINEMMRLGADRLSLKAKVFGGGNVTPVKDGQMRVGSWNTQFALNFLNAEGIPVLSKDVGGEHGRRIVFFTREGNVKLRRLGGSEVNTVAVKEAQYRSKIVHELPKEAHEGELTLF